MMGDDQKECREAYWEDLDLETKLVTIYSREES